MTPIFNELSDRIGMRTTGADFDVAPLAWVKGEIDLALARALATISHAGPDSIDAASARQACVDVHQVTGVLQMIGLTGAARFSAELEALLRDLAERPQDASLVPLARRGSDCMSAFLEQLLAGQPDHALRMYAVYKDIRQARRQPEPHPVDLYFPRLAPLISEADQARRESTSVDPVQRRRFIRRERARYGRGLLRWLRQREPQGQIEMSRALAAIGRVERSTDVRGFWRAASALAEAVGEGLVSEEGELARLWLRLERQQARAQTGAPAVAERLAREVLFHVARTYPATAALREVQLSFRLTGSVPETYELADTDTDAAHLPRLRALKEVVQVAKTAWTRYASGHTPVVGPFCEQAVLLRDRSASLGRWELSRLAEEMLAVADKFLEVPGPIDDSVALEVATGLLLLEDALATPDPLPAEFGEQFQTLIDRMRGWRERNDGVLKTPAPILADVVRRAQNRMAIAQLVAEIQANLRSVERALDGFFRDHTRRALLTGVDSLLMQVAGAFRVLDEGLAAEKVDESTGHVRRFVDPRYLPVLDDFELVAQLIAAMGAYAEAMHHGPADFVEVLAPAPRSAPGGESAAISSVETEMDDLRQETQRRLDEWFDEPADAGRKETLRVTLEAIQQDASIVSNPDLERRATEALSLLERGDMATGKPALEAVMRQIAVAAEPVPAPSRETAALADSSPEIIDAELLAIYLEEASDVLTSAGEMSRALHGQPPLSGALSSLRRGFHTLKGSGRMVGLLDAAETAYSMECVLDHFLEAAHPANDALRALLDQALRFFEGFFAALRAREPLENGSMLRDAADALRRVPLGAAGARDHDRLFAIFIEEAAGLTECLSGASLSLPLTCSVPEEAQRAAHTLGGIAATAGYPAMNALALALEGAMGGVPGPVPLPVQSLFAAAIDALVQMVAAISAGREPAPAETLVLQLHSLISPTQSLEAASAATLATTGIDRLDEDLLPFLIDEAQEILPRLGAALRAWGAAPQDVEHSLALQRALHTLKGSARTAGAMRLGATLHDMETMIDAVGVDPALIRRAIEPLLSLYDQSSLLFDQMLIKDSLEVSPPAPAVITEPTASDSVAKLSGTGPDSNDPVMPPSVFAQAMRSAPVPAADTRLPKAGALLQNDAADEADLDDVAQSEVDRVAVLRVRAEVVDRLVNAVGEVSIARSRIDGEVRSLKASLSDLADNVQRLRQQMREIEIQAETQMQSRTLLADDREFDPLEFDRFTRFQELTRLMAESVNDVGTVQSSISRAVDETESALASQQRLARDLQQDLLRVRMLPVSAVIERMYRVVRQAARETGRQATMDVRNGQVELDRSVLERLTGPLEHVLRNAVVHGIEDVDARRAAGKPDAGQITIHVRAEGNQVAIDIRDDGRGLAVDRIKALAIERGLLSEASEPDDARLAELVFQSGFSTADEVTPLAGRGIGMDVVRADIAAVGGRVELRFERGRGTQVSIVLPLTLIVTQTVLVGAAGHRYMIPSSMVEEVRQLRGDELISARRDALARASDGRSVPFFYLPHRLGNAAAAVPTAPVVNVLFVRAGASGAAVQVDQVIGNQEIVVKNTGPLLARIGGITGATVLGAGEIVLIINPVLLLQRSHAPALAPAPMTAPAVPERPLIMIVDDSLTVRRATERLLDREGLAATSARDGIEALELVRKAVPTVMLVDIEMPRMDGFDLVRNLKADPVLARVPLIMISSRTAEKHQRLARDLGVDVFLGKPYREDELVGYIRRFIEESRLATQCLPA